MTTTQTPLVTGVDFMTVPTTDVERSVGFYEGTLGLPCSARWGEVVGAEFETGNLTVAAFNFAAVGMEPPAAGGGSIAFRVDDVAAARAELESRGVEFQGEIVDSGVCHQAYFADADGNHPDSPPEVRAAPRLASARGSAQPGQPQRHREGLRQPLGPA